MKILLVFLFYLISTNALSDVLDDFYKKTQSLSADFIQTIYDKTDQKIEQSQGQLKIKRPDNFFLHYQKPDEQQYISDGKRLWMYDVELEQVTIKKFNQKIQSSPLMLLSSQSALEKIYKIQELSNQDFPQAKQYLLTPLKNENDEENASQFSKIRLSFEKQKLLKLEMWDNFEHKTELRLFQQKINPPLNEKDFDFIAPENIDIIDETLF